ncbi:ATP-dependent DNA ligase [Streptomyces sp. NPDC048275]|uniref:ATP-dependent DNA ligase n=1 Tax=Streptomyces sp. NPDC048275 TaxID=3155629 RepID=UPI0034029D44
MDWPVSVALAQSVPALPTGTEWSYEVKLDGHRMIMWRTGDGVRLQARSGRDVTAAWADLALAGLHLPAGAVLDGEAVITTEDGRISFEAAQARAASSPARARRLAAQRPAHYIAFDALQLPPPNGDIRAHPYTERRANLLNLLHDLPADTPIQAVSATTDRDTALTWYNTLHNRGVEGLVAKRATSPPRRRPGAGHGLLEVGEDAVTLSAAGSTFEFAPAASPGYGRESSNSPIVDRPHARHYAPAPAKVLRSRRLHPTEWQPGVRLRCYLDVRQELSSQRRTSAPGEVS